MGTIITSKRKFINMLNKQIKDDEIIIFTTEMNGEAYAASKRNPCIRLPFAFAGDAFKQSNSLNAVMRNPCFAVTILPKSDISQQALDLVDSEEIKEIDDTFELINDKGLN